MQENSMKVIFLSMWVALIRPMRKFFKRTSMETKHSHRRLTAFLPSPASSKNKNTIISFPTPNMKNSSSLTARRKSSINLDKMFLCNCGLIQDSFRLRSRVWGLKYKLCQAIYHQWRTLLRSHHLQNQQQPYFCNQPPPPESTSHPWIALTDGLLREEIFGFVWK